MTGTSAVAVWFEVPDNALEIDLEASATAQADRFAALAPNMSEEDRGNLASVHGLLVSRMRGAGVQYAAHLLHRVEGVSVRLSTALVTMAVGPVAVGARSSLERIASAIPGQGTNRECGVLDLPAGPALALAGAARTASAIVWQGQLSVASPDRSQLVTLALATPCWRDWEAYVAILGAIARTISFTAPSPTEHVTAPPGRIAAALDGG